MILLRRTFSLDLRSIALFRVLLALLILFDLLLRSQDMIAFYTDAGVLPRRFWLELTNRWHWSLHAASGELWWQILLFGLAAVSAVALLLGYRSKFAALISFVLLASLINRNILILHGGDLLLVIMSFWSLFLPLGARFSIDAALTPALAENPNRVPSTAENDNQYFSMGTIAIVFQILYLYIFTALLKTGDAWTTRFDAAFYAVSLQHYATPIGTWISQFPELLKLATRYVLSVEFLAPLLVLCPLFWPWLRLAGLLLLASLHMAFLLMLHIGLFPLIDFMALSLLIPGALWAGWQRSSALKKKPSKPSEIRLYFDEDCGFCLKMCLILRALLLPANAQILPAQQYPDIYPIMLRENSWVVTDASGATYIHWHAMAFLFAQRWPFKPLGWFMSSRLCISTGNAIYRWVADNRPLMGSLSSRVLPIRAVNTTSTWTGSAIAAVFLVAVTAYNVYELPQIRAEKPSILNQFARVFRVNQRWDMFAPYPLTSSSYVLIPATLRNGEKVNLYPLTSSADNWQPPDRFYPLYESYRWRKYLGLVNTHKNNAIRKGIGNYYCQQWNQQPRSRDTQLATFEINFVKHQTNTLNKPKLVSQRRAWRHWCFAEFADG